jgi:hypothetical protein
MQRGIDNKEQEEVWFGIAWSYLVVFCLYGARVNV